MLAHPQLGDRIPEINPTGTIAGKVSTLNIESVEQLGQLLGDLGRTVLDAVLGQGYDGQQLHAWELGCDAPEAAET